MNNKIIFAAFIGILFIAGTSMAQQLPSVSAYKVVIDPRPANDLPIVEATFPGTPNRSLVIFEAVLPASSETACLASRDFSSAYPASPDRASVVYDATTNSYKIRWAVEPVGSCRVLLVVDGDGQVDAGDYGIWRTRFGNSGGLIDGGEQGAAGTIRVGDRFTATVIEPSRVPD